MHCTAGLISAIVSRTLLCRKHTTVRFMRLCIKKSDNREPGMLMIALRASLHRRPMHILFLDYFESRVHEIRQTEKVCSNALLFFRSILDQLVKLAIPATACNMSASFVGRVPAEIAALIFEYAIDPVGPPVPAAPTEWPRRIGTLADGCTTQFIILSCTSLMEY